MGKRTKVRVTCQQGNTLLMVASSFVLPQKLGDTSYTIADRGLAEQDVGELYRELKSRSPLLLKDKKYCFGPADNWRPASKEAAGREGALEMADFDREVELCLNNDALSGAFWCLVTMLHAGSDVRLAASSQVEVAWPLAEKLRLKKMLRKEIGLETAVPRRLDLDGDEEEKKDELEEVEETGEQEQPAGEEQAAKTT